MYEKTNLYIKCYNARLINFIGPENFNGPYSSCKKAKNDSKEIRAMPQQEHTRIIFYKLNKLQLYINMTLYHIQTSHENT
jgi:hypothetical protein